MGYAQSEISLEERLSNLETKLAQQNTVISNLQSEVQAVLKQNLALKKALSLKPTITEFKTDEFIYKLHEAVGDSINKKVHLKMTITNTTPDDIDHLQFETVNFINEKGIQNPHFKDYIITIGGNNEGTGINYIYADSPTQLDIVLENFDPSAKYVKVLEGKIYEGSFIINNEFVKKKRSFTLRNIPIRWR
ncbi:MAG: hypothetical protein K2J82_03025 [Muribaculaceae bacterium]|nr:hypothetical protein [Muribaculaceae bacterium]